MNRSDHMDNEPNLTRTQEIGKRLAKEREDCELTLTRAALQAGVTPMVIKNFEAGKIAPSLPQLELLALLYRTPVGALIAPDENALQNPRIDEKKIPAFIGLRNRIIATTLKQARLDRKLSLKDVAVSAGVSVGTLKKYENAVLPVPLTAIESMTKKFGISMDTLFSSLVQPTKKSIEDVSKAAQESETPSDAIDTRSQPMGEGLPQELQEFIANPANLPYIELAKKLSTIEAAKLRTIAEGLLEITL